MKEPTLQQKLEALIYIDGGEVTFEHAAEVCGGTKEEIAHAAQTLAKGHGDRGVVYVVSDSDIALRVAPICVEMIAAYQKKSFSEDVGPAALEILSILLYRGPSSQAEIDTIRGVHSSYSLRSLRIRGLIERTQNANKAVYSVTAEALAHLGVTSISEVPDREKFMAQIKAFETRTKETEQK
jgi:segregation and condensation protein B